MGSYGVAIGMSSGSSAREPMRAVKSASVAFMCSGVGVRGLHVGRGRRRFRPSGGGSPRSPRRCSALLRSGGFGFSTACGGVGLDLPSQGMLPKRGRVFVLVLLSYVLGMCQTPLGVSSVAVDSSVAGYLARVMIRLISILISSLVGWSFKFARRMACVSSGVFYKLEGFPEMPLVGGKSFDVVTVWLSAYGCAREVFISV